MGAKYFIPKTETPPNEIASAYKNYLYKAAPSLTAEDFQAGAPIPTDQVDKDIIILENKIAQYKKFGFPCDTEEGQLKKLNELKSKVKGKHWPGNLTQVQCSHKGTKITTNAQGETHERCPHCGKVWKIGVFNKPKPKPETVTYYSPEFVKALKTNLGMMEGVGSKPQSQQPAEKETKAVALKIGRSNIDQQLIMQMGMLSNCNISIHQTVGVLGTKFMVACKKCDQKKQLEDHVFVSNGYELPSVIVDFCKEHRHDPRVTDKEGRMFRED